MVFCDQQKYSRPHYIRVHYFLDWLELRWHTLFLNFKGDVWFKLLQRSQKSICPGLNSWDRVVALFAVISLGLVPLTYLEAYSAHLLVHHTPLVYYPIRPPPTSPFFSPEAPRLASCCSSRGSSATKLGGGQGFHISRKDLYEMVVLSGAYSGGEQTTISYKSSSIGWLDTSAGYVRDNMIMPIYVC